MLRPALLLFLSGCHLIPFVNSPCETAAQMVCDECNPSDAIEDIVCGCVEDGEVSNPRDYYESQSEAELACSNLENQLDGRYLDDDEKRSCAANVALLRKHGKDACPVVLGYGSSVLDIDDTGIDWSDTTEDLPDYDDDYDYYDYYDDYDDYDYYDDYDDYDYDATFSVTNTGYSVEVQVVNSHPDGYYFGMAETGAGESGWYGEDGISGSILHEVPYGYLSLACANSVAEVVSSYSTLHCFDDSVWARTTYAFFGNENGDNWETVSYCGGHNCSYYE